MLGADYYAVGFADEVVRKFFIIKRIAGSDRVGVVEGDLGDERIVVTDIGSVGTEKVDDRQCGRLSHVIDVLFVCNAEDQYLGAVNCFAFFV